MATRSMSMILQHLRSAALLEERSDLPDGQLLEHFVRRREPAALELLVRRHGPMVWGVCRRLLHNYHDAEDAFQATFLVLVRKAASIMPREMVGNWLYGVAQQTALKARATRARRRMRERPQTDAPEPARTGPDPWSDLQPLLDQELSLLPDRYRSVLILCDLEGKTRSEAARHLGCPEGTVASRLARARTLLAKRLARRGLPVSSGVLAAMLSQKAVSAAAPTAVLVSTIEAVTAVAAGQAAAGVVSLQVATLTEGVMKAMLLNQFMRVMAVLLVLSLIALGGGLVAQPATGAKGVETEKETAKRNNRQEHPAAPVAVRPSGQREVAPFEIFTGRLEAVEKAGVRVAARPRNPIAVCFEMDERSYLRYQRLLKAGKVKGAGDPLAIGLAEEDNFPRAGVLDRFADRFNPDTGTISVCGALSNTDGLLRPGMFVRVRMNFGPPAGAGGGDGSDFQNPEMGKLQGVWQMQSLIGPQGNVPQESLKGRFLVIEGHRFVRKDNGKTVTEGSLAIDTTGKQKVLVLIASDRKAAVVWALYQLEGDQLKVCYELLGKGRPADFKASATQSVATYARSQPKKQQEQEASDLLKDQRRRLEVEKQVLIQGTVNEGKRSIEKGLNNLDRRLKEETGLGETAREAASVEALEELEKAVKAMKRSKQKQSQETQLLRISIGHDNGLKSGTVGEVKPVR